MAKKDEQELRKTIAESLSRMQTFDVQQLRREGELGQIYSFTEVVEPAARQADLYRRLPISVLDDLPPQQLQQIGNQANQDFNRFDQILKFDATQQNAHAVRQQLINQVNDSYQQTFGVLHPLIAYSLHKTADFQRLEGEARATLQGIKDEASKIKSELEEQKKGASLVLEQIREVAAEQGVTQQASYFRKAADDHDTEAEKWRNLTGKLAWTLGIYAFLTLFFNQIPWFTPTDTYQAIQLGVSKLLIFAVISFMLYLAARNFLSHKHNAIINRHRQNALLTYKALVEGATEKSASDAVLMHAAACIYGPQPTGYAEQSRIEGGGAKSVIELLSKPIAK